MPQLLQWPWHSSRAADNWLTDPLCNNSWVLSKFFFFFFSLVITITSVYISPFSVRPACPRWTVGTFSSYYSSPGRENVQFFWAVLMMCLCSWQCQVYPLSVNRSAVWHSEFLIPKSCVSGIIQMQNLHSSNGMLLQIPACFKLRIVQLSV